IRVAEALLPPGQAHLFGAWSIVDTELTLMLNRLAHSGDDLPAPLRDYAAAQWQRASVQAWLRHYEAARG
ncbi:glutathione S-transferase, partial [Bordetella pertussis]